MTNPARYAVLFKAFFFDDFVRRRLARVVAAAPSGDVYLMIDETRGPAGPTGFARTIRYCEADVLALGFADVGTGGLFWYNADYPLYYFQHLHPDYAQIIAIEYDAVPNIGLEALLPADASEAADFVAQPIGKTLDEYWWTGTMLRFYPREAIRPTLMCLARFPAAALRHLAAARLRQGTDYPIDDAGNWPIGETFVGTELALAGFRLRPLAGFGRLSRYDWWPPTHERELADCPGEVVVHPVLTGRRYLASAFKSSPRGGVKVLLKFALAEARRRLRRRPQAPPLA